MKNVNIFETNDDDDAADGSADHVVSVVHVLTVHFERTSQVVNMILMERDMMDCFLDSYGGWRGKYCLDRL